MHNYFSIIFVIYLLCGITLAQARPPSGHVKSPASTSGMISVTPDLPLLPSNEQIEAEISTIVKRYSDSYLGINAPSASALSNALLEYDKLQIVVTDGDITGKNVTSFNEVLFLKTFAQYLKVNPDNADIREKADRTVWWITRQMSLGLLSDRIMYTYRHFARAAVCLSDHLSTVSKELFTSTILMQNGMESFYQPSYDVEYQLNNLAINTDMIYNISDAVMACAAFQETPEERYRYMRTFKRLMERFFSHTIETRDGIKADGTGFHHKTSYDSYMYAYGTAAAVLRYLDGTSFQVEKEPYLIFRDAVYAQMMYSNDDGVKAFSMSGRHPQSRSTTLKKETVGNLAIVGQKILRISTADPLLAGEYNRVWGSNAAFNYSTVTPFSETAGFYQFNHASAGVFRKNDWVAVAKGFTDKLWGTETYAENNRYGRYQSYGALEIIYKGNILQGNGYDVKSHDWNYNPGATTIVLPWNMLHAQTERIDEYQQKEFAGSLAFRNKNFTALHRTYGSIGMFAMDFQQREGMGFGKVYGPKNHTATFTFKKSVFMFDDVIICLGSNINNNHEEHPTVTTLFQRLDNIVYNIWTNGHSQSETGSLDGISNNWLLSNYQTGFYVMADSSQTIRFKNEIQQTPNQEQTDPSLYTGNPAALYWLGYIDHGPKPVNAAYEYMVMPATDRVAMAALDDQVKSGNKPYKVLQKDATAHIVEHRDGTRGYALFRSNSYIDNTGLVSMVSHPSLIMYQYDQPKNDLLIALSNPALGFSSDNYLTAIPISVTLRGTWVERDDNPKITVQNSGKVTVVTFMTKDGLPEEVSLYKPEGVSDANFTGTPQTIEAGSTVQFNDLSTHTPTEWHWTFEGGVPSVSSSPNPEVLYANPGTYAVTLLVTNPTGTDFIAKTDYITVDSKNGTGISVTERETFSVYPNPADDVIYLTGNGMQMNRWMLSNIQGVTVMQGSVEQLPVQIDVSSLSSGIYVMEVVTNEGKRARKRVVLGW